MKRLLWLVLGLVCVGAAVLGICVVKETVYGDVELLLPWERQKDGAAGNSAYAGTLDPDAVVARIGDAVLTNGQLQVYYRGQIAAHFDTGAQQPDLRLPLSSQKCTLDERADSWEQYFLVKALDTWHAAQALTLQGDAEGLPLEEAYAPDEALHEKYLQDKAGTEFLYGYNEGYRLNTLHSEYIQQLPQLFGELAKELGYADAEALAQGEFGADLDSLLEAAEVYNRGYSYYTALTYLLESKAVEATTGGECVTFRQVLLIPEQPKYYSKLQQSREEQVAYKVAADGKVSCVESGWVAAEQKARNLLFDWSYYYGSGEGGFGQIAYSTSLDEGSKANGGLYENIVRGQLPAELEEWLFDEERMAGDTTVLRSGYGVHILYFGSRSTLAANEKIREDLAEQMQELIADAKAKFPMEVDYEAIVLVEGAGTVSFDDFLYEDLAHERFPEVPLYLQRDYEGTMYGAYPLATHGCGLTSMAMLSSYLGDEEWTPPELCALFGDHCGPQGTGVSFFWQVPCELGFYYIEYVYEDEEALQALQDGYQVIARETVGPWTAGGHYIVLEKINEDGKIIVRDSNIFNFGTLEGHVVDYFDWDFITPDAAVYFIFSKKTVTTQACCRCGDPDEKIIAMVGDEYLCSNCDEAILRRSSYLLGTV